MSRLDQRIGWTLILLTLVGFGTVALHITRVALNLPIDIFLPYVFAGLTPGLLALLGHRFPKYRWRVGVPMQLMVAAWAYALRVWAIDHDALMAAIWEATTPIGKLVITCIPITLGLSASFIVAVWIPEND